MTTERQFVGQIRKATNQIDFSATYAGMLAARELDGEHIARLAEFTVAFLIYYVIQGEMTGMNDKVVEFGKALILDNPTMAKAYKDTKGAM